MVGKRLDKNKNASSAFLGPIKVILDTACVPADAYSGVLGRSTPD